MPPSLSGPFAEMASTFSPPWWFDAAVQVATTVLAAGVSVYVVMLQLRRQHLAALEQQRNQSRQQLYLEIFKDITSQLSKAGESSGTLNITTMTLVINLKMRRESLDKHGLQLPGYAHAYTPERLFKEHDDASRDLISVLSILEDYEIAFSGFDPIRRRIAEKLAELSPKWGDFDQKVLPFLVINTPQGIHTPDPPTSEVIAEIEKAGEELQQVLYDMMGFIMDVRVAAQNHLLPDIFPGSKAKERQPQDPRFEVLRPHPSAPAGRAKETGST